MIIYSIKPPSFLLLTILLVIFSGCSRTIEEIEAPSYDYLPLITGKYKIYAVDSIVYNDFNCSVDTSSYQIKELTGDTVLDGEDAVAYKVELFRRENNTQPWQAIGIWLEKIEDFQLQRVEENQRIIPLVFPVTANKEWDGIVYIRRDTLVPIAGGSIDMYKDWDDFKCIEVDAPYTSPISLQTYNETALILQVDKTNNIERRYSLERYAKNIGLIYKEMKILDTQCKVNGAGLPDCQGNSSDILSCRTTPWEIKAEKGFIIKQTLLEHNY